MTNTGDFRRYSYSTDASYALKAFDLQRSSAAPAYTPEKKRDLKVRENKDRKSKSQLRYEEKAARALGLKFLAVASLSFVMLAGILGVNAKKNELIHEISSLETQLSISQSEGTRLSSELDALVSVSMIDRYAVENLGMTKVKSNQIRYIDVNEYKEGRIASSAEKEEQAKTAESAAKE